MDEEEFGPSGIEGAEGRRLLHVVILAAPASIPATSWSRNRTYPQIASDYSIHSMC